MGRRAPVSALAAVVLVLVTSLATAVPAEAASSHERSFSKTKKFWFAEIKRCVVVKFSGRTTFSVAFNGARYGRVWWYTDRKVHEPVLQVTTYNACGKGRKKVASDLWVTQTWASSTCGAELSYGISAPWGVSVGVTPGCREVNRAVLVTEPKGKPRARVTQFNSMSAIRIPDERRKPVAATQTSSSSAKKYRKLCHKAGVSVVVRNPRTNKYDNFSHDFKPCFSYW